MSFIASTLHPARIRGLDYAKEAYGIADRRPPSTLHGVYAEAIEQFEQTLTIDPEDLQAHYNLMLCYNGIGDAARSKEHEQRYLRFKALESGMARSEWRSDVGKSRWRGTGSCH
jgi:tetratricopeptide (TPR) repeat protein